MSSNFLKSRYYINKTKTVTSTVEDIHTNKIIKFDTIEALCEFLSTTIINIYHLAYRSHYKPLMNTYKVTINLDINTLPKYKHRIFVYDYIESKWSIYNSSEEFNYKTGLSNMALRKKKFYKAGYTVCLKHKCKLSRITKSQAIGDRNKEFNIVKKEIKHKDDINTILKRVNNRSILLYNYNTKDELEFNNIKELIKFLGYNDDNYIRLLLVKYSNNNIVPLLKGYGIQYKEQNKEWGIKSKKEILNSIHDKILSSPIYIIGDMYIFGNIELEKYIIELGIRDFKSNNIEPVYKQIMNKYNIDIKLL